MDGHSPIDRYLSDLHDRVARWHRRPDELVAEARDHLRERADTLQLEGLTPADAEERAIADYGSPAQVVEAHLRAARRPAIPTTTTRDLGTAALAAGALWILLPVLTAVVPDRNPYWAVLAMLFHAAVTFSVIGAVGLWLRHGGLGPLAVVAAGCAALSTPFVVFAWPIPAWSVLLGLASLALGVAVIARGIAPWWCSVPFTLGFATAAGAMLAAEAFVQDRGEDFAFLASTPAALAYAGGLMVFGAGMLGLGLWLRSETPVDIPALPAPTPSHPAGA